MTLLVRALLGCIGVALGLGAAGCFGDPNYWDRHPDALRISAAHYTFEPIFDTLRGYGDPPGDYELQILMQNDSGYPMTFARYDAATARWIGPGLILSVATHPERAIGDCVPDFRNISESTLRSGEDSGLRAPLILRVKPDPSLFEPDRINRVKLLVELTLTAQGGDGEPLGPRRTVLLRPELLFLGHPAPRIVTVPGQ